MSDIVERLHYWRECQRHDRPLTAAVLDEAAAEIARLRAILGQCVEVVKGADALTHDELCEELEVVLSGIAASHNLHLIHLARDLGAERDAARALLPRAWEAGRDAARPAVDCGCENRAALLEAAKQGHNSGARWQACGNPVCAALDALAIAALRPPPDLAQQLSKESGE